MSCELAVQGTRLKETTVRSREQIPVRIYVNERGYSPKAEMNVQTLLLMAFLIAVCNKTWRCAALSILSPYFSPTNNGQKYICL